MSEVLPCALLLIEPDVDEAARVTQVLSQSRRVNFTVLRAASMAEGLALIERSSPDIVFLTLRNQRKGGLADLEMLTAIDPTLPVVGLASPGEPNLAQDAIASGAQDVLKKDTLNPSMLERVVRYALERQRSAARLLSAVDHLHARERDLRAMNSRLEAILAAVPLAVVELDRHGSLRMASRLPPFVHPDTATGMRLCDAMPLEAGARLQWHLHRAVLHQSSERFEVDSVFQDGRRGTWVVDLAPAKGPGGAVEAVTACFRDVTEERQIARRLAQSDRMATVGVLAASLTQEINNPMTAVLANAQSLVEALPAVILGAKTQAPQGAEWLVELEEELPAMASDVAAGAARVQRIVADLHRFAAVTERFEVVIEPARALRAALNVARTHLPKGVTLQTSLATAPAVRVDESRLVQVIVELLSNAARVVADLPSDQQRVDVSMTAADRGVRLSVRDHGPGVTPEDRARLVASSQGPQPAPESEGIGLAMAARMVATWGGRLEVADHPDGGSVYTIVLPGARSSDTARTRRQIARQGHAATPVPPRGRVLLVDGDTARSEALRASLSSDHEVLCFTNLEDAKTALDEGIAVHAILCRGGDDPSGVADFSRWLGLHRPRLASRIAVALPADAPVETWQKLAGLGTRLVSTLDESRELREMIGKLVAA
jgi:signal transduction histidine kinase